MKHFKIRFLLIFKVSIVSFLFNLVSCSPNIIEENKIFHAGPNESGFGGTFFSLYKNNYYQFCDGDFMNPGCYSGSYSLNEDTLTLDGLKLNDHLKSNRFLIYRFSKQDSSYWQNKYPMSNNWRESKESDSLRGFEGDIYELDENNKPNTKVNSWYVIRFDIMDKE